MTSKEENAIKDISNIAKELKEGVLSFKNTINEKVEKLENKVIEKHNPVYFEKDILATAQSSIQEAIKNQLTGYNSPLNKLILSVVDEHSKELRSIINEAFVSVIKTEEFKASIVSAFSHKVSRSIISNNGGLFDKVSNELKQDPQFKAKLTLAVANVVEDCLKK
jgi:hypothetical protein